MLAVATQITGATGNFSQQKIFTAERQRWL